MENPSLTVLLAEDDPDDVFLMKRACQKTNLINGLQVVTDGRMAIDYLAGAGKFADRTRYPRPGVAFLDLKLPYKPGFEVMKWMRTRPELESVVVVILSSSSEERDRDTAYRLGARMFLVKPPTPAMLLGVIKELKHSWAGSASPQG